jgi:hypothetical protein
LHHANQRDGDVLGRRMRLCLQRGLHALWQQLRQQHDVAKRREQLRHLRKCLHDRCGACLGHVHGGGVRILVQHRISRLRERMRRQRIDQYVRHELRVVPGASERRGDM